VTVWPSGGTQPGVSTLNDGQGVILANAAIVPAGAPSGGVSVFNSGPATTDLIIDMNGFYAAPSDLNANTAVGSEALVSNTTGISNTANGSDALQSNTTGSLNTATGSGALQSNTTGNLNTATGVQALQVNTTGNGNTATGYQALYSNTTGLVNTANGYSALSGNTTGSDNTAVGYYALLSNGPGASQNTGVGSGALSNNTTGSNNVALGYKAAFNLSYGNSNNIHISSQGSGSDSGTIRIGTPGTQSSFFVAGVNGVNLGSDPNAVPVVIDSATGQLGVLSSSPPGIIGVTAGTDLTGGGTSGTVTLNLDTTKVPTLAGTNSFSGGNTFAGNIGFGGSLLYQGSPVLLVSGPIGNANIGLGIAALSSNTTGGGGNTATGYYALAFNTTGGSNTAIGNEALRLNTTPNGNTAIGADTLQSNTTGAFNTATGFLALANNTTGSYNVAVGSSDGGLVGPLLNNTTGSYNVAIGSGISANFQQGGALQNNTTGSYNIAIGFNAADNVSNGNSNNIEIGSVGASGDSGTIRIGTAVPPPGCGCGPQTSFFVAGVTNVNLGSDPSAVGVLIDTTTGQLGVASSSRRYKEDIEDMGEASHDLMRLRPVTFRYKKPFTDGSKPIQYGLIAEEVDEVYPDLVAHSADGQIETVKYQVLDSMLLNEVQRQQAEIRRLEERLAKLEAALTTTSPVSGAPARR
jgi:hypothetical protein